MRDRKYELLRLWVLGTWIANRSEKRFYLVNLVRADAEREIEQRFGKHIIEGDRRKFVRLTWEDVYRHSILPRADLPPAREMAAFMRDKTLGYGSERPPAASVHAVIARRPLPSGDAENLQRD